MKLLKSALLASAFVGFSSLGAVAIPVSSPLNTNASVEIVGAIQINEDNALNFGKISPPASSFSDVTLAFDTGIISRTGTAVLLGGEVRGSYDFSGNTGSSFTLTTTPGSCTGTGLTLLSVTHGPVTTLPADNVPVGGVLRVDNTASTDTGVKNCAYTVAADY